MNIESFENACIDFANEYQSHLTILSEDHYQQTLELLERFLDRSVEGKNNPYKFIIDMLSTAIEDYENKDPEVIEFLKEIEKLDSNVSLLNILMDQYNLKQSELPEIGDKSTVSRILSGERKLNTDHIQKLSNRFGISPSEFF